MADFKECSLQAMLKGMRDGDFSSRELTSFFLDRIGALEGRIHAFLSLKQENALQQADRADALYVEWRAKSVHRYRLYWGCPSLNKDVLCVMASSPVPHFGIHHRSMPLRSSALDEGNVGKVQHGWYHGFFHREFGVRTHS